MNYRSGERSRAVVLTLKDNFIISVAGSFEELSADMAEKFFIYLVGQLSLQSLTPESVGGKNI